ncbi:MAG: putative ABC exporter domain-containing protein [Acidobacteriia bacterium]|nr:putative ABC exporter domain-containing protein [Terriglobia bacterium]
MIATFLYYLSRSFWNRVVSSLKRLRQPKYLISALVGLGYMGFFFIRPLFLRHGTRTAGPIALDSGVLPVVETGLAFLLLILILLPWIWPGRRGGGLKFTEAEIQFLFPAPISRRALINFRLIRMQLGILFGVLISFLFFGRGGIFGHPVYALVVLWLVYSFLGLYHTGTSLVQTSLAEHGRSGFKRQVWTLALLAAIVVSVVIWMKWFIPPLPEVAPAKLSDFWAWVMKVTEAGPAYYFLYPFRTLVHPVFAPDPATFLLRLIPASAILGLAYLWVMRSDVSFEEASLELARKVAARLEAARSGALRGSGREAAKVRRPLFQLAPAGFAHTPIFWKNLISAGRISALRILILLLSVGVAFAIPASARGGRGEVLPAIIGSLAAMLAGFLTLLGPMMIRDDLRSDLLQVDLLKTYPIPGWSLVLGEVLAPAALLAAGEWFLLLVAACVLPTAGSIHPSVTQRLLVGLSAAFLLPCFSLIGVLIQNAAALLWPGWVELGKARRQGVEAMGQRLITMLATVFALVFAVIPAALLFAAVFFLGSWLIGLAVLPIAALVAALGLLTEAGLAILWLGRLYDKFDVSLETVGR